MCTPMKLDKSNTNYLVGFEPTAHKDTAHHMILYGCKSPARQEAIYNCGGMEYHMDQCLLLKFLLKSMFNQYVHCTVLHVILGWKP